MFIYLLDKMKKTYKELYKRHEIHKVDGNDRIVLKEVDVSDFAVKLKIGHCSRPKCNFRDEAKRYLENLKEVTGDVIDISNLIDDEHRVTFIRGIAGMGKSVLTKQLAYGWANGEIYQSFEICVMLECRDLNYFKDHEGTKLEKLEILSEFLKSKVSYDLGDGEGVLFIVDGLDELFDITEKDSIIGQLLCRKIYPMSKVILTGRPHIESKLDGYRDIGGLKTVEIQGLTNEQINKYVEKFSKHEDHILDINKAKGASNVPIIHVPQFLNTLCCIAILLKGQPISNSTELYCWTVFLLLKQHADKHGSSRKRASEVFSNFSQTLLKLGEVCHKLLTENKIIFEGNIKSLLGDIGKDKEFIESLFVDVSNNITEKYQFKHLSLMEFLSALYICKIDMKNLMQILKENLEKGFIEVVSFVCRLMSGFSYEGIIKEMLKNVIGLKEEVNEKQLLCNVIELLYECRLDKQTKLDRAVEIIGCFLNKNFHDKEVMKSIIRRCHGDDITSNRITTDNICRICRHLESCGWKEDDIRMAFENVWFRHFEVSNIGQLGFLAVKNCFHIACIWLIDMETSVNAVRKEFEAMHENGYCEAVGMKDCKFHDQSSSRGSNDRQLPWLSILSCEFKTESSFFNVCDWGVSFEQLFIGDVDIDDEWWEVLVKAIEQRNSRGDLIVMELLIDNCHTRMSREMEIRVRSVAN